MNRTCKAVTVATGVILSVSAAPPGDKRDPEEAVVKEAGQLDLYTANVLHDRLQRVADGASLTVGYDGPLGRTLRPVGLRAVPTPHHHDLTWSACRYAERGDPQPILFRIHASLAKRPDTAATVKAHKTTVYLRASFPSEKTTLDTPVGGTRDPRLTIRQLIARVETGDE